MTEEFSVLNFRPPVASKAVIVRWLSCFLAFVFSSCTARAGRTDANGHVTHNHYDGLHRLTQLDLPLIAGQIRTLHTDYDVHGDVVAEADAGGHATTHHYDALGRRTSTTLPSIVGGRRITEERPLGFVQSWTYEPIGDVHSETDADGRTTTKTYTPRRYLDSETNNAGETTTYAHDGEGHRTSMRRPLGAGHDWTYAYDEGDRLIRVTDPVGAATSASTTFNT